MNTDDIREAIEKSSKYWEKRALENKLNIIENEDDYIRRLTAIYEKANKDIDDKLAKIYARYAKENKLTLEEAYKILPKKMETEYKRDVMDYIEKAKSGDTKWKQYLLNQSIMHKHSVLDQLRTEIRNVVYNIDMETTGGQFLEKIYANSNYYAQYSNGEENFARVDTDRVKRLLEEDWSGGNNFSSTIWKNKEQLVQALDDIVVRGLAVGESYDKMAERLAKRMGTATTAAKRLIRTESARMDNVGLLDYYKKSGVTHLEFVATLDMRTSDICRAMDGELIPIEKAQVGLNVPPLHPYCRSVIAPVYADDLEDDRLSKEKRAYRDKDTNKTKVGEYKNYVEYLAKHLGNTQQANTLASTKNGIRQLTGAITIIGANPGYSVLDTSVKEITGYDLDDEYMEYAKRRNDRDYEHYIQKGETTREEIDEMFEELKEKVEDVANEVAIRVKMESMEEILKSGKIVNGFEVDKIHNFIEKHRREAEKEIFNIPDDAPASDRPIYGYLRNLDVEFGIPGTRLSAYGDIKVILKDKVKDKCTITIGDSLDHRSTVVPSKLTDIKQYSVYYSDLDDIVNKGFEYMYGYPEVQIFEKLKLSDIKEVEIPEKYKTDELEKLFKDKKVNVKWK